jgi:hypothetical protein
MFGPTVFLRGSSRSAVRALLTGRSAPGTIVEALLELVVFVRGV